MNLYVINHGFHYELENVARLFFPNEKITVVRECERKEEPYIYTEMSDKLTVEVKAGDFNKSLNTENTGEDNEKELSLAQMLYKLLCEFTGINQPWGLLTGVRPIKLFRNVSNEQGFEKAKEIFANDYYVSPEKLNLAVMTEENERKIIELSKPDSFSLYVGVPFCPSRCSYCSFVMSSIERAKKLVDPYADLLCEEIKFTAEIANKLGLRLETVYFGGGTPTTLSAEQLSKVIGTVNGNFNMSACREFTVEAGRPDTVTEQKLNTLFAHNVGRISINPQTFNDAVRANVGRRHTTEQTIAAYNLARKVGFENINMDFIAGLNGDTLDSFKNSIDTAVDMGADSVTVHNLALKSGAYLVTEKEYFDLSQRNTAYNMIDYSAQKLSHSGYYPYYMYRQSKSLGNLENVGWCKSNKDCLYNVFMMDETHTVLAAGAGAVTKLKNPQTSHIERIYNFKYPYEYINDFQVLIDRKSQIVDFYNK